MAIQFAVLLAGFAEHLWQSTDSDVAGAGKTPLPDCLQAEEVSLLVNAILEQDGLHQLVHRLRQFREAVPEEATAVQKTLSVFENLVEVNPDIAEQLLAIGDQKSGFLK